MEDNLVLSVFSIPTSDFSKKLTFPDQIWVWIQRRIPQVL